MSLPSVAVLDPVVISAGSLVLPPQRRLMILLMLALAALLHVATSGWGPIENGSDGMNAAISRELALGMKPAEIGELWNQPVRYTAAQWLTMKSFQIFNVSEWSARLPFAVANLLIVALVFLIAERMGGFWRGLSSGIMAATTIGMILHGRDGGGGALTALAFTIMFYAAVRMLEQKSAVRWQVLYWCAIGALLLLEKPFAAMLGLIGMWMVFACFRQARIRMRLPGWIACNLAFFAIAGFFFHDQIRVSLKPNISGIGIAVGMLFPWSVIMVPPFIFRFRKIVRKHEINAQETLLWSLFAVCLLWIFLFPKSEEWPDHLACLTAIFTILSSKIWERVNCQNRMVGVGLLVTLAIGSMGFCGSVVGRDWSNLLHPIWWLSSTVLIVFGVAALIALALRHSRAALLTIAASTIPLAYNLLDAHARFGWQLSMRDLGNKVDADNLSQTPVYFDDNLMAVSSFLFYAPHGLHIQPTNRLTGQPEVKDSYLLTRREETGKWPKASRIGGSSNYVLLLLPSR